MVLLEEKGEGSGSRSSHGLSADNSRSSPFSGATSHCALLSWGFSVTTTLPEHRPVTPWAARLPQPLAPAPSSFLLPSVAKHSSLSVPLTPHLLGQEVFVPRALGIQGFGDPQAGHGWLLSIFIGAWEGAEQGRVLIAAFLHFFPKIRWG